MRICQVAKLCFSALMVQGVSVADAYAGVQWLSACLARSLNLQAEEHAAISAAAYQDARNNDIGKMN